MYSHAAGFGALAAAGVIVNSNDETVEVQGESQNYEPLRANIADVDHPGNVLAAIGGVLTSYGLVNIFLGAPHCADREIGTSYCLGVFTPAVLRQVFIRDTVLSSANSGIRR